jgi:hypothetical protein
MNRSRAYLVAASPLLMSAAIVLAGTDVSNAQSPPPYSNDTVHHSAGRLDARGYPWYGQRSPLPHADASGAVMMMPQRDFQLPARKPTAPPGRTPRWRSCTST